MPIQAFVDESGGKGHTRHFALCGLVAPSEDWAEFSKQWQECLGRAPSIKSFKMTDAVNCNGQFRRMQPDERDDKLRSLARIINLRPKILTSSVIDLESHAQTWAKNQKPQSDPYFWPYQNTIMAVCHALWDAGWRERFEVIYDENAIFGPRARLWYPVIKKMMEISYPEQATILPIDPVFRTDDQLLPLQAADMFAWCRRDATDRQGPGKCEWLLGEFSNVQETDYSQYYDLERLSSVVEMSRQIGREGKVPPEIVKIYRDTHALMKRR